VLGPGELREGVDIRMTRSQSFCLDGVVEGANGPGVMQFSIQETQPTSGRSGNGGFYTAVPGGKTGPDGKVRICGLHSGEYELSTTDYRGAGSGRLSGFGSIVVPIGDRDVTNVRLALRFPVPLAGEVVWDGTPPEKPVETRLPMQVESISRTIRGQAASPIPGTFDFGGLAADEFSLDILSLPPGIYVKDVTYGDRSVRYGTIRVGSATGDAGLRVTVARDGGTVTAGVMDKDSHPVVDCTVIVMPPTAPSEAIFAAMLATGKTGLNGAWTSPVLAPGKYLVLATRDTIDRSPEAIGKLWKVRNRATEIDVPANGKAAVTLDLKPIE